jgi:hypothetical protein
MIFWDHFREDGSVRREANDQVVFVYACRDHLSPKREEEIQKREKNGVVVVPSSL